MVFIEQYYNCHYFKVHGQWTKPASRDSSVWRNSPTLIARPVVPGLLAASPRTVIQGGCR